VPGEQKPEGAPGLPSRRKSRMFWRCATRRLGEKRGDENENGNSGIMGGIARAFSAKGTMESAGGN